MSTIAPPMPKKTSRPKPDEADEYFLLRLPVEYRELLKAIQEKTLRSMTIETQIALERRAAALGVKFTPNYPASL